LYSSHHFPLVISRNLVLLTALVALGAASCSGAKRGVEPVISPTDELPTGTATAFQWFPPTVTPPAPAAAPLLPTPEQRPGIGRLLVSDDMTSTTFWNASASGSAAATVSADGLTLSAQPGMQAVISLHRSAAFDDVYIEVTARTSLCRERDGYGLVFRAADDVAFYRISAICDGTVAAERVSLGRPRVLQAPTASADVPMGAPGEVRLGLWALGSEFRVFLNDHHQFSFTDPSYGAGGVGVFVQAAGDTPVVVTFSGLSAYQVGPDPAPQSPIN
jgi:hypothetical protein